MDLLVAGNVQIILKGLVTQNALHSVPVTRMPYALGGSALPNSESLEIGETIVYEGEGHIFTSKGVWTETNALKTPFLMGIAQKPKELFEVTQKQSIQTLYQALFKRYPEGFAIVGEGHFSHLSMAYLQLSPIYGENVNELHDKYWHTEERKNQSAKLFGVALKKPDPRAFYSNPNEKTNPGIFSHTHVLATHARHLLTDSVATSGIFWIEAIDSVKSFNAV